MPLIILLILLISPAHAAHYYVSNTGNDSNPGTTIGAPWKTIAKVNSSTFLPGDDIHFKRGGTWAESLEPPSGGAANNYIVFDDYDVGPKPIITGSAAENCIKIRGGDNYLAFLNLHLRGCGSGKGGISAYGPGIVGLAVTGLEIETPDVRGIYVSGVTSVTINSNIIHGAVTQHGIYIDGTEVTGGINIYDNVIYDNAAYGIQFNSNGVNRITDVEVYGNSLVYNDIGGINNIGVDSINVHDNHIYGESTGISNGCDGADTGCTAGAIDGDYVNNSIVVLGSSYATCFENGSSIGTPTFDTFNSNICYHNNSAGAMFAHEESITGDSADGNNFCAGSSSSADMYWDNTLYDDFAAYKAGSGQDTNGFACVWIGLSEIKSGSTGTTRFQMIDKGQNSTSFENPSGCTTAQYAYLQPDSLNYKLIYMASLTAMVNGMQFDVQTYDCATVNGNNAPVLTSVEIFN